MSRAGIEAEAKRKAAPKKAEEKQVKGVPSKADMDLKKGKRKAKISFTILAERAPFYTGDADLFQKTITNVCKLYGMTFAINREEGEDVA